MSAAELVASLTDEHEDGHERGALISELHRRGDRETLAAAASLTRSPAAHERALGAHILGQLGYEHPSDEPYATIRRGAVEILIDLSRKETDGSVTWAAITALGEQSDLRALDAVLAHLDSPDSEIRQAVAAAFPGLTGWDASLAALNPDAARRAVAALIALGDDDDGDVRDWALFALGTQYEIDTPAIRDLLVRHLDDPHQDAQEEALVGLAVRRDERAFPFVLAALEPEVATRLAIEAAGHLGDERLLPRLQALSPPWPSGEPPLRDALRSCAPGRHPESQ